jgi:polyphosphate kinase
MNSIDINNPDLFINRELSLLEFNRRVIAQANDEGIPLLERLKFLCISSTNLDEFFEIRVAGIKQQVKYNSVLKGPDNLTPIEVMEKISTTAHELVSEQYRVLNEIITPALAKQKIRVLRRAAWKPSVSRWVKRYFNNSVLPILSPIGLDPSHPFPRVLNKNLYFIISLEGKDAFGRDTDLAIVQAPRSLPRVVQVPTQHTTGANDFILLSSIIHAHVSELFPGMKATGCYQFKVTRDSDLFVDSEEVADNCPAELSDFLLNKFELNQGDLYQVNGMVNLNRLMAIVELAGRPDMLYAGFVPDTPPRLLKSNNIFDTLRNGDILLHHPFQSFSPVIEFVRQAADDPNVLSIKQTLYRTGVDSAIVESLKVAARMGKEVTVVIELRARFDEETNIEMANELQDAGAHVVYGIVGYKTHSKMCMVIRKEARLLRRYVHLGTGNYHSKTARLYTDYGLLTCDKDVGLDVNRLFLQLTGLGRAGKLKKLLQSPFTLFKRMLELIEIEANNARAKKDARIVLKMNALVDPDLILALYKASQAGVKIDLIIRGMCCLRPGIKGISETIQVRSIIGRFLEHTRVFYFFHGGEELIFCSSADWMPRNMHVRVETAFPIEEKRPWDQIFNFGLQNYLTDNSTAWLMQSDGTYKRAKTSGSKLKSAQQTTLEHFCD